MILIQNRLSHWMLGHHYRVMCVWPVLFVRPGEQLPLQRQTLVHEQIHVRQQLEMLWVLFFIWYGFEFLVRLLKHRSRHTAYSALSHEKEAHAHDTDNDYLKKRKLFAWVKYLL
jgi:hypothetical protein